MKAIRVILFVALAAAFVSCGPSRQAQQYPPYPNYGYPYPPQYPPQQYVPQDQNKPSVDGYYKKEVSRIASLAVQTGTNEIRAFGQAISPNEQMAISQARSQATAALQTKVEVYVRAAWDQYMESTGVNGQYGVDDNARSQVITAVKSSLSGADDVDFEVFYNPTDRTYKCEYCVKYNKAGVMSIMNQHSARIKENEKQFEKDVQHAWDFLDAKYNRETLGEQQAQRQNAMQQDNMDRQHQRDMEKREQYNDYRLESQRINR